jgi:hypothetical protein
VHLQLQGYRGLIASDDLSPGDVVVSVPLHNILQVPRQLTGAAAASAAAAAAAALDRWQQQHGELPGPLLNLILGAPTQHLLAYNFNFAASCGLDGVTLGRALGHRLAIAQQVC